MDINNKKHQEFVTYSTDNNNIFQLDNNLIVSKYHNNDIIFCSLHKITLSIEHTINTTT